MPYVIAIIAGLSGFLFGYDEGVIAGALAALHARFSLAPLVEGLITAAVPFGALFGSLAGGRLADSLGRRGALVTAGTLFAAGAALSALADGAAVLCAARLTLGLAIGFAAVAAPLYIAENAPPAHRGMLVSFYQLAITLGILGSYTAGFALGDGWRTMFAIGALPGAALALAMLAMRDTPRWLVLRGRDGEARAVLARSAPGATAEELEAQLQEIRDAARAPHQNAAAWTALFSRRVLPATIVGVGLFALQQLSGINAVIYYAPMVFAASGFDTHAAQLMATIGVGAVNVAVTVLAMALIDRIGRRRMLYLGFSVTAASLAVIAVAAASGAAWLNAVALAGLFAYIAGFAISLGPLPWLMMSEIFPLDVRPLGMGLAAISNWTLNALVVMLFPMALSAFGLALTFAFFAACCAAGLAFTRLYVPETAGASLEQIEAKLSAGAAGVAGARG